jgi:hypothetical protein
MPATRRLAAILAADVAGYSRLMGMDEEGTLDRLKAHRRALVDPKIREHHGRIVKTTGDGMLVEFSSVVNAMRCAAEIQWVMADRETEMAEDRRIRFRIGINLGDIIADDGDIFGDGVSRGAAAAMLRDRRTTRSIRRAVSSGLHSPASFWSFMSTAPKNQPTQKTPRSAAILQVPALALVDWRHFRSLDVLPLRVHDHGTQH